MNFDDFDLNPDIAKAVSEAGYAEPTDIQVDVIPKILEGHDIRASAQTGTGKTAAFLLPALNKLSPSEHKGPKVLILAPTRELAMQISDQAKKYSKFLKKCKTVCVSGGVPYHKQTKQLARPYEILIATPGRLIDFINRKKIDLSNVEMFILDEADRMLDMGFIGPVEEIASKTPPTRQTLLFSATLRKNIIKLSQKLLKDPIEIKIHAEHAKNENISQTLHFADDLNHKNRLLEHILANSRIDNAIVFTSTKRHASQLAGELKSQGYLTAGLHGDMNQRQRTRTIAELRKGKVQILVATDVAARGIDVQSITHVINFDLPQNAEDYVHRIGRTGRAGAKGEAFSFATNRDAHLVKQIEKFTGQLINITQIEGLEPRKKPSKNSRRPNHNNKTRFRPKKATNKRFKKRPRF